MNDVTLSGIKDKFLEFLTLKDSIVIDIVLGTVTANQFENADPVNLYLIGPPSSAKTEILMSLQGNKHCYITSSLTSHTFISGFKDQAKGTQKKNEYSLLLRLQEQGKNILVFKDFTTVLGLSKDNQTEIISQIREIVDGYFKKDLGNKPTVEWKGKLGFMMGVTPVIDRFHTIHSQLGERFLSYRMDIGDAEDWEKQSMRAFESCGVEAIIRPGVREMVTTFMEKFANPDINSIYFSKEIIQRMHYLAEFVGRGRAGISRDHYHNIECLPAIERTPRLIKQFKSILAGVAIIQGKSVINYGLLKIIRKIARDSIPQHRDTIIKALWDGYYVASSQSGIGRSELADATGIPSTTIGRYLEDLQLIGVVERIRFVIPPNERFRLIHYFEEVVARSEVYKDLGSDSYDD